MAMLSIDTSEEKPTLELMRPHLFSSPLTKKLRLSGFYSPNILFRYCISSLLWEFQEGNNNTITEGTGEGRK
jgi:hypothetical protein